MHSHLVSVRLSFFEQLVFNGNGYDKSWPEQASKRKVVFNIPSGEEVSSKLCDAKNIDLFEKMKVLSKEELIARRDIDGNHYIGLVEIEAGTMINMATQSIVPALKTEGIDTSAVTATCEKVKAKLTELHHAEEGLAKATCARELRLEVMIECRKACDEAEEKCPASAWPFATYRELLCLDQNQDHRGVTVK
jgi:glutamine synthetase